MDKQFNCIKKAMEIQGVKQMWLVGQIGKFCILMLNGRKITL